MKTHSIARRVVTLVLLVEVLSALCMTGFVFVYERHTHFHSLDLAIRGRADTLMGAVVDAEDTDDRVVLDLEGVHLPEHDLYQVWDNGNNVLGHAPGWTAPAGLATGRDAGNEITVMGVSYRMVRIEGMRVVDPAASGIRHSIVVVYGSPALQAWEPVRDAVQAFALASFLLVALSALLVNLLVRSSMSPLAELAEKAGLIADGHWYFAPPARARQTRELVPLVSALEDLVSRLRTAFAQQRQFVSDSAHELKTSVTVVKSSLQLLQLRQRSLDEYRCGVLTSLSDCLRMEELVQRMLTLARVEEGSAAAAPPIESLAELHGGALAAMATFEPLARLRGLTLSYQGPADLHRELSMELRGAIAAEDWQTLCTNLLLNSLQHSPAGSHVLLTLSEQDGYAVCRVQDHGTGIPAKALPHVFDRFYRSDASRARATGGSGLGLAICKAIVDRAEGRLSIESVEGEGTVVTVQLTLREAAPVVAQQSGVLVADVARARS